jgi:hypothetical protein
MLPNFLRTTWLVCLSFILLCGCSPQFNWRLVTGPGNTYEILLPGKPVSFTRPILLGNTWVDMTMTAAQVDEHRFAVGVLTRPEGVDTNTLITQMAQALSQNVTGAPAEATLPTPVQAAYPLYMLTVNNPTQAMQLIAHFAVLGQQVYQLVVLQRGHPLTEEEIDTFFSSFHPQPRP